MWGLDRSTKQLAAKISPPLLSYSSQTNSRAVNGPKATTALLLPPKACVDKNFAPGLAGVGMGSQALLSRSPSKPVTLPPEG